MLNSATITWAHHSIVAKDRKSALLSLYLTIVLAIIFTVLQGFEYFHAEFTIADGVYGSTFYMTTGFHGCTHGVPFLRLPKGRQMFNSSLPRFMPLFQIRASRPTPLVGACSPHGPKVLSSNLIKLSSRKYTTFAHAVSDNNIKHPYWITGFADAESYFSIRIGAKKNRNYPWTIIPLFGIELHEKDFYLLKQIQTFFGVGTIIHRVRDGKPSTIYSVQSIKDLQSSIIPHFKKYPMLTQKQADFELFCMIIDLMVIQEHLNFNGLSKILSIKAAMNKGLSSSLKKAFPSITPISRPIIKDQVIKDPYWLVGFVDGEGCFYINMSRVAEAKRPQIKLTFSISQHTRDLTLLNLIKNYFNCGIIETVSTRPYQGTYVTYKFEDILEKIIPFFKKHALLGLKLLNFQDFCKASELIKNKDHLTDQGREKILFLKSGMNTGRSYHRA